MPQRTEPVKLGHYPTASITPGDIILKLTWPRAGTRWIVRYVKDENVFTAWNLKANGEDGNLYASDTAVLFNLLAEAVMKARNAAKRRSRG
jgi:hypothetical protein